MRAWPCTELVDTKLFVCQRAASRAWAGTTRGAAWARPRVALLVERGDSPAYDSHEVRGETAERR